MSLLLNKDEKIIVKFNILKQGLIIEKEKTSKLHKENIALRDDLQIHKELLAKLQNELSQIKSPPEKTPLTTSLFNALFLSGEDTELEDEEDQLHAKDTQIETLTQENADLKAQIQSLTKEKEFITSKLNEMIKEYEEAKSRAIVEIERTKQYYKDNSNSNEENYYIERINAMSAMIVRQDKEKIESEKLIDFYEKDQKNKINIIAILYQEQNIFLDEIEELRKEISQLNKDNNEYADIIDKSLPITRKTVFKGRRMISNADPKLWNAIYITFGIRKDWMTIREPGKKDIEVSMGDIPELKEVETNKIRLIVSNRSINV